VLKSSAQQKACWASLVCRTCPYYATSDCQNKQWWISGRSASATWGGDRRLSSFLACHFHL